MLVVESGEDDDGRGGSALQHLTEQVQPLGVGKVEVEQHAAAELPEVLARLGEGRDPGDPGGQDRLVEEFLGEEGVAWIVFDQQDVNRFDGSLHLLAQDRVVAQGGPAV